MKKRLEAELISIAHRILKLKNHSELKQLHLETQKLCETLSVLKFVEENINIIQPKIDIENINQKLEHFFDNNAVDNSDNDLNNETQQDSNEVVEDNFATANDDAVAEITIENTEIPATEEAPVEEIIEVETPIEEDSDKEEPEIIPEEIIAEKSKSNKNDKKEPVQISFDEFKFTEPVFEKKSEEQIKKPATLNDKLATGINIGLNDKIAFVKNLFGNSTEDYNRVLSQINTFDNYLETVTFINDFVKPDYDNWDNQDEYVLRFMEAVEKKFI